MRYLLLAFAIVVGCDAKEVPLPVRESTAVSAGTPSSAPSEPAIAPREAVTAPLIASSSAPEPKGPSPEQLARGMKGVIVCGKQRCIAGKQTCVVAPDPNHVSHCEPIAKWVDGRTPYPQNGTPPMAGLTACDGSHNCPEGSVCCLHEIGNAVVQAVVCHQSLDECRDREEMCSPKVANSCRTPGTRCDEYRCVAR